MAKTAPVIYGKGKLRADTRKLDAMAKATDARITQMSATLDSIFGDTRGSALIRGETAWGVETPNASGDVLTYDGTDTAFAQPAATPTWAQIGTDRTVDGVEVFTDLGAYQVIWLQIDAVTASSSSMLQAQVSADNGSNYLTSSGDYKLFTDLGTGTDLAVLRLTSTNATAARYSSAFFYGWNLAKPKMVHQLGSGVHYINTSSALNALRVNSSAGNPNGGTIRLFGIPA
jgi:hypothetical protein